jgi:hypothetical protein
MNNISPQVGGQWEFLSRIYVNELLFGGAAGPGKSWGLIIDVLGLQYEQTELGKRAIDCSDYRAVLFRRKTTQFTKLLDEGDKYYPLFGAYKILKRTGDPGPSFNFPSGARIFICHMEEESNKEDHQGQEYQYVGFDELTQFTVTQYTYLLSRLRSTIKGLNTRMRSTTNPTGSGLIWVKKRFPVYEPNIVSYYTKDPKYDIIENPAGIKCDGSVEGAKSRLFIPGRLYENKILLESDPNYKYNIEAMGKKFEKALLDGDWDAFGGTFFDDFTREEVISPFVIPEEWKLILAIDPGFSSPCAAGLIAQDFEGNFYSIATYYEKEKSPSDHARDIKKWLNEGLVADLIQKRKPNLIVSGLDAFAKKDRYSILATEKTFADQFLMEGMYLTKAVTDRHQGWWAWKSLMPNRYFIFDIFNIPLIEEITAAEQDERDPEDLDGKGNDPNVSDHALDMTRYGIMSLFKPFKAKEEKEEPITGRAAVSREKQVKETTF